MTNAQINSFMAVVRYHSFSKAADHMYVSQSAISKNIAQLEKDIGYILIDRTNGSVSLTAVGELFYEYFAETEERFKALNEKVSQLTNNQADDIRLGCLDGWDLSQFYPQIRNVFRDKYPAVKLNLEGYNHVYMLDAISENKIDVGITLGITVPRQSKFTTRTIATAPAIMMISASHPMADRDDLQLIDLRDEPFYVIAPTEQQTNPMEQLALQLCRAAGFEPKIEYAPNSASILMRLQSGLGAQITCAWTCASHFSIYKTLKLNQRLNVTAVWLDDGKTPAKHLFVNELLRLNIDNN